MQRLCSRVRVNFSAICVMRTPTAPSPFVFLALCTLMLLTPVVWLHAGDKEDAEKAASALAYDQEAEGYNIRAEVRTYVLEPKLGKATRMQLFKGNEYCFCVAVPKQAGVQITGAVLDLEGKPAGEILPVLDGWGFVLFYKPKKTGMYRPKLRYAHQGGMNPPIIIIHGNSLEHVTDAYKRFLEGRFRKEFDLVGTPLLIQMKSSANPYSDKD